MGLVVLGTLALLFLMTGSVIIPIKALLLNVISLGAALGVVVWIFQEGHLEGLLGFSSVGAVESIVPFLVLAFGFGLSMDYEVFLLSRIVEFHRKGYENDRAVSLGPAAHGPHHHVRGPAHRHRLHWLRRRRHPHHQADGSRSRRRRPHRRDARPDALRARDDDAARTLELVGAGAAAPAARPLRDHRVTAETSTSRAVPGLVHVHQGLDELLAASGHHPFVRWEVTDDLAGTWWRHDEAVAFQRVRRADRRTVSLLGADDGVTTLLDALPAIAAVVEPSRRAVSVSVPQHLEPLLRERYRVMDGGDWEWLHTGVAPAEDVSHERVQRLDDSVRAAEIRAFLEAHSPTADTTPGARRALVRDRGARRAPWLPWRRGAAARAGAPHLSSVAVDTRLRGRGLGRTIVGALTRWAVAEAGVCTLGMYSHNAVARELYLSLGYDRLCAWSSRPVVLDR